MPVTTRTFLFLGAAAAILASPAIETSARSRREQQVQAQVVAPVPAGPVGLPDRILADASAYEAYLARATATSPGFTSGQSVADALKQTAGYEPAALVRGEIAYGAIAALKDPTFVAEIRQAGNTPENRKIMAEYFLTNPTYPFNFKGSDTAAGLVKEALGRAGLNLFASGKVIKQSAYDVQHQSWSREEIVDRPGRLASVEAAAKGGLAPAMDRIPALQRAASGVEPLPVTASAASPPYTPLIARAMQLAAVAALGEATDSNYDRLTALGSDSDSDTCLHMAKLNLYQCLAVAKPHYEDIFCMGQHALADTGVCLAHGVGVDTPPDPIPPPKAVQASTPTTVHTHHRRKS